MLSLICTINGYSLPWRTSRYFALENSTWWTADVMNDEMGWRRATMNWYSRQEISCHRWWFCEREEYERSCNNTLHHPTSWSEPVELLIISVPLYTVQNIILQLIVTSKGYVLPCFNMHQWAYPIFQHSQAGTHCNWTKMYLISSNNFHLYTIPYVENK